MMRRWTLVRRLVATVAAVLWAGMTACAQGGAGQALYVGLPSVTEVIPVGVVDSLWFDTSRGTMHLAVGDSVITRLTAEVGAMWVGEEHVEASITFGDAGATALNPYVHKGVTVRVEGSAVTVDNANTSEELTFALHGMAAAGSFTYNGAYKTTLRLDGVSISSPNGPALDIQCGKRIALLLADGTSNSLSDAVGDHRAALYCKGHLEVSGGGELTVEGRAKHAIATKEDMQLKRGLGAIHITGAAGDGIHAGQYFQMNGGTLTIRGTAGDGIQAEATSNADDELNGQMLIHGGTLDIETTADDTDALQSSTAMLITAAKSIPFVHIKATGKGGKGIKAGGTLTIGDATTQDGPVMDITTTGARSSSSSSGTGSGTGTGTGTRPGGRPGGGGGWPPGGGGGTQGGSSAKAIKAQGAVLVHGGELTISTAASGAEGLESKTSVTIAGGRHYMKCYDDCINSSGPVTFAGGVTVCCSTGNDAVDSNYGKAGAITIGDGVVLAYTTKGSPEEGLDCDNNSYIRITGSGIAISAGGAQGGGSSQNNITGATQGYAFVTSSIRYATGRYYTLSGASGRNLITYSLDAAVSSTLALFTAPGMTKGKACTLKYSTTAPTDAQMAFHGLYLGSSAVGTTSVATITAK